MGGVTMTQFILIYTQCEARFFYHPVVVSDWCWTLLWESQYLLPAQSSAALRYICASKDSSKRFFLECKWGHPVWTEPKTVKKYTSGRNPDVYMKGGDRRWRKKTLEGHLELAEVPLVHVVVSHQLVAPGELLLAVGPPAVKRLLAWRRRVGGGWAGCRTGAGWTVEQLKSSGGMEVGVGGVRGAEENGET